MTFEAFRDQTTRVAAGLLGLGIAEGTMISWQLPTRVEAVVLSVALSRLGVVQNPIIHLYRVLRSSTGVEATHLGGTTAHYLALLAEQSRLDRRLPMPELHAMCGGGAPKPAEVFWRVKELTGVTVRRGYGMTECPMIRAELLVTATNS